MDYYHLFKILYFANQRSLVDWGQLMIADKFCALPHGPVPTILYSTIQGQKSVLSKMKDDVYVVDYYLLSKREPDMDYKKAKLEHNKITEALAEQMKLDGKTDLLLMTAGPYKNHSCMSAYCVDAQKMADAVGMICWGNDGKIRYFSQILFHE